MNEFDKQYRNMQRAWFVVDMLVLLAVAAFMGFVVWSMVLQ